MPLTKAKSNNLDLANLTFTSISTVANSLTVGNTLFVVANGNVGVSNNIPGYKLHVTGDLNFTGDIYQNGFPFSGSAKGNQGDSIFFENGQTITASYTLVANENAMSAGPITVNAGVTVNIASGSVWTIV